MLLKALRGTGASDSIYWTADAKTSSDKHLICSYIGQCESELTLQDVGDQQTWKEGAP